jgi:hypothetical protein
MAGGRVHWKQRPVRLRRSLGRPDGMWVICGSGGLHAQTHADGNATECQSKQDECTASTSPGPVVRVMVFVADQAALVLEDDRPCKIVVGSGMRNRGVEGQPPRSA